MIWSILRVSPQREIHVAAELTRGLGIRTYVPTERINIRRGVRTITHNWPLMRGYVFAGSGYGFPWRDIRETRGVTGWLCTTGDVPAILTAAEITRIRALELEHNRARDVAPSSLGVGAKVRVTKGAFESIHSLIRAVRGPTATIEVPMLGSTRSVQVPLAHLKEVA